MITRSEYALITLPILASNGPAWASHGERALHGAELLMYALGMGLLLVGLRGLRRMRHHRFVPPRKLGAVTRQHQNPT